MAEYDGITHYLKAAVRRLEDAEELLSTPQVNATRSDALYRHTTGAVYLAGYAVECVLKAYILQRYNFPSVTEAQKNASKALKSQFALINTSKGHDLGFLLKMTDLEARMENHDVLKSYWAICRKWSPVLRYDPTAFASAKGEDKSLAQAKETIRAIREFHDWVRRMIGV